MQAAEACAAETWVYPFLLVALYESATCGVSPATRDYIKALLGALRRLPLRVLTLAQAQQAAQLAWRTDEALAGQALLRREVAEVRAALAAALEAACELSYAPEATLQRGEAAVEVRPMARGVPPRPHHPHRLLCIASRCCNCVVATTAGRAATIPVAWAAASAGQGRSAARSAACRPCTAAVLPGGHL